MYTKTRKTNEQLVRHAQSTYGSPNWACNLI